MPTSSLEQVLAALTHLRAAVDNPSASGLDVELLRTEIGQLITVVESEIRGENPETAYERYLRLQDVIEPAFESLRREWSSLRASLAAEAAKEYRGRFDLEAGWRNRWGPLYNVAWTLRAELEREISDPRFRTGSPNRQVGHQTDRRGSAAAYALALDLRYVGKLPLPLTQIAGLVGLSTAAVQMRIAGFEDEVLQRFGRQEIANQLPAGWREVAPRHRTAGARLTTEVVVVRNDEGSKQVVIALLPVKDESDVSAGRPRGSQAFFALWKGRQAPIWAVIFEAGPEVRFVPVNAVPDGVLEKLSLADLAKDYGRGMLAEVLEAIPTGQGGSN